MKLIITENQFKFIVKERRDYTEGFVDGLDDLLSILELKFPQIVDYKDVISNFIVKSGCPAIEIKGFKIGAAGLALHDKVVYNPNIFNTPNLGYLLYVIFHEIAHQYQYRKYGRDKMYELYNGVLPINDAVEFLKYTENTADQFAIRKCRELIKLGVPNMNGVPSKGYYSGLPDMSLKIMLVKFRNLLRQHHLEDNERISEILYNNIIATMQQ